MPQIIKEATTQVLIRGNKLCNFVARARHPTAAAPARALPPRLRLLTRATRAAPRRRARQEWREYKLVYKRYASLYFCVGVDPADNELITLETIHQFVEVLDRYFGNVCELDLIFNFHKAYYVLDEVLLAGELQESSKKLIGRVVAEQDAIADAETPEGERG